VRQGDVVVARFALQGVVCLEAFKEYPQLGRFTLRDEGKTVARGKVLKVIEAVSSSSATPMAATSPSPQPIQTLS
jgi:hypothetical protein